MRTGFLVAFLTMTVALAGCSDKEGQYFNADMITPGQWVVSANTDYIMAWAQNGFPDETRIDWNLTFPEGAPLPDGWTLGLSPPASIIDASGTSRLIEDNYRVYTDHAFTLMKLELDPAAPGGTFDATLHAGDFQKAVKIIVAPAEARVNATVSEPGDEVFVQYTGRFYDSKEEFDSNVDSGQPYLYTVGSGQAVLGFDMGLIGLADGERALLAIPAGLAYGHHIPEDHEFAHFNGRNLEFSVNIVNTDPEEGQQGNQ